MRIQSSIAATAVGVAILMTGCGDSTVAPRYSAPKGGAASTPTPLASIDLTQAQAAAPGAHDTTVALTPQLYGDPGNPCAPVASTESVAKADPNCALLYIRLGAEVAAGPDVVSHSPQPRSAFVDPGVPAAQAIALGNGFYVSEAVRSWAISLDAPKIIPAIDGISVNSDAVNAALTTKPVKFAIVPDCQYATGFRVAPASKDVQQFMALQHWPSASATAIVATYAACPGIKVTFQDGTTTTILGHPKPVSIVMTGRVGTVAPFGPLFVEDGWAPCGAPALKSLCG